MPARANERRRTLSRATSARIRPPGPGQRFAAAQPGAQTWGKTRVEGEVATASARYGTSSVRAGQASAPSPRSGARQRTHRAAFDTGTRKREVLDLRGEQVDLRTGTITLAPQAPSPRRQGW